MTDSKLYELVEGLNVNLTCRIRRNPMNPITWRKDGTLISMENSTYINIYETPKSSLLSLSGLKLSDSGNYSCESQTKNVTLSKWIFLKVRRKAETARKEGSHVVADEPNTQCATLKCAPNESCTWDRTGQRFRCAPTNSEATRNMNIRRQRPLPPSVDLHDFSNSPHFDSVQSTGQEEATEDSFFANHHPLALDYEKTTLAPAECTGSLEGCNNPNLYDFGLDGTSKEHTAVIGGPFPLIGIGTMCALFLVIVLVSAFVIRRKIVRRQMEISRSQRYNARNRFFISPNQTTLASERRRHQVTASGALPPRHKAPCSAASLQSPTLRIPRASTTIRSPASPIELKTLTANANVLTEVPARSSIAACSPLGGPSAPQTFLPATETSTFDQQEVLYLENCLDVGSFLFIQPAEPQWRLESENQDAHQPHHQHAFFSSPTTVTTTV